MGGYMAESNKKLSPEQRDAVKYEVRQAAQKEFDNLIALAAEHIRDARCYNSFMRNLEHQCTGSDKLSI